MSSTSLYVDVLHFMPRQNVKSD